MLSIFFFTYTAYPLPQSLSPPPRVTVLAGDTVSLPPLISPGALTQQYYIDWRNAETLETVARIEGPRSQQLIEPTERYSVDPDTFALIIDSVRFEDRGFYLGVIGVMDPAGSSFVYTQTEMQNIELEVYGEYMHL